ncbi:MAG: glycogen debranching protein, partial [Thermoleophilaceae bacterium]
MASPTLATSNRLDDRRYVAAGDEAYVVCAESGRFPGTGWHTRGEIGGIWTPPLKLLDGMWFGVDGNWLGKATKFESGYGYVKMTLPGPSGVTITRTDFAPDGRRAALIGLTFKSSKDRSLTLAADAHSELMSAYPWDGTTPTAADVNQPDSATLDGSRLVFTDGGHPWSAAVGSTLTPTGGKTGKDFRGPQDPPVICPASGDTPAACDDSATGKGAGGELDFKLSLSAGKARTVWFGEAGSQSGAGAAKSALGAVLRDPSGELQDKIAARSKLAANTQLSLPGDPLL